MLPNRPGERVVSASVKIVVFMAWQGGFDHKVHSVHLGCKNTVTYVTLL